MKREVCGTIRDGEFYDTPLLDKALGVLKNKF